MESLSIKSIQRRQEFELPEKLLEVIEHQIEVKQCVCGKTHQAFCEIKGNTQYGNRFKTLMVYLNQFQFIPFDRLQQLSEDCFGIIVSDGVLEKSNQTCYEHLEQTEEKIKQALIQSAVIHNDETGVRCEGKTKWVHSTSTSELTYYYIHNKRGTEAINSIGILPEFTGKSIHDRWASYNQYTSCQHGYCNAHLLRDLKHVNEEHKSLWALPMKQLLIHANDLKKKDSLNPIN